MNQTARSGPSCAFLADLAFLYHRHAWTFRKASFLARRILRTLIFDSMATLALTS
jgi:hypothetical protein